MKVLFLDIDGVLNSMHTLADKQCRHAIDAGMVSRINKVIDTTSCQIVVSSAWRILWELDELHAILTTYGFGGNIIDKTPSCGRRDDEILAWLKDHPQVQQFAVVDDDSGDLTKVKDQLVQTSFATGILDEHVDQLINLLNNA